MADYLFIHKVTSFETKKHKRDGQSLHIPQKNAKFAGHYEKERLTSAISNLD